MASALDDYEVHPLAAIFPMLSDEELADLAEDIKANGLLHPIVRTVDGQIVDGRNRVVACGIAGVEPEFEDRICDDEEARALIVSANLQRRNMTKGQQAVATAMLYPEAPDKGGRGIKRSSETDGVSATRLKLARTVLRHDPNLAAAILSGTGETLDHAYEIVKKRQQAAVGRAQVNVDRAVEELRALTAEMRIHQQWALEQALAGRPALELTWGNCIAEKGLHHPNADDAAA